MQIGKAGRPKPGEVVCGDWYSINNNDEDEVLIAVADGLGHGPLAADAAREACEFVQTLRGENLEQLIIECGTRISATRGVALTLLRILRNTDEMHYAAVGNVELRAISQNPIKPINYPGIVGRKIRRIRQTSHRLTGGDIIVIFTDGVSSRFNLEDYKHLDAQDIANQIIENHGKLHDDATCIAIKY